MAGFVTEHPVCRVASPLRRFAPFCPDAAHHAAMSPVNRRSMLKLGGLGAATLWVPGHAAAGASRSTAPTPVDTGKVVDGKVQFPAWRGEADPKSPPLRSPLPPDQRVGFAIVALGRLSLEELIPAFGACGQARLTALVSGTPDKLRAVASQYGVPKDRCYDYSQFEALKDAPDVKAVYIVLPNSLHREYVQRAAAIGKHVLCEKPMATSSADAQAMVEACQRARVKLMVAYRMQYQPHQQRLARLVREQTFGRLVSLSSVNVQTVAANGTAQWRHKRALSGGGALPDIGLYCINTTRFLTGEEPIEVFAQQFSPAKDARYADVEESVAFTMRFPSNLLAQCFTSYGARDDKYQRLNFAKATVEMPKAYSYRGQKLFVSEQRGEDDLKSEIVIPEENQFARELDHFAACILENKNPRTPGEEGLQDQRIMEALYESVRSGVPVKLRRFEGSDVFRHHALESGT